MKIQSFQSTTVLCRITTGPLVLELDAGEHEREAHLFGGAFDVEITELDRGGGHVGTRRK